MHASGMTCRGETCFSSTLLHSAAVGPWLLSANFKLRPGIAGFGKQTEKMVGPILTSNETAKACNSQFHAKPIPASSRSFAAWN